jgi:hypothetical protein
MIHRAVLGSLERMMGILIEHTGGRWPFWLSPRQVLVVSVASRHAGVAARAAARLRWGARRDTGLWVEVDVSERTVAKTPVPYRLWCWHQRHLVREWQQRHVAPHDSLGRGRSALDAVGIRAIKNELASARGDCVANASWGIGEVLRLDTHSHLGGQVTAGSVSSCHATRRPLAAHGAEVPHARQRGCRPCARGLRHFAWLRTVMRMGAGSAGSRHTADCSAHVRHHHHVF